MTAVVDTNVPVTANGHSSMSPACVLASIRWLEELVRDGRIAIDTRGFMYSEYRANLSPSGQPGVGDRFLRWVLLNQWNPERCDRVPVTPQGDDDTSFVEFPDDPRLRTFDRSDRVFVAVATAHRERPPIVISADTDWLEAEAALRESGVKLQFLCRRELEAVAARRRARRRGRR